jgi:pimeloyl-ACP methyl ester carboxylesterase
VSTGVHPVRKDEQEKRAALQALGREEGFDALVDRWLPPMIGMTNRENEEIARSLREMCLAKGQDVFDAQVAALLNRPPVYDLLPRISCPALVMVGALDEWSSSAQHEEIAAAIPSAELVVVPNAGHMLMAEVPEAVNTAVKNWLDRPE